MVTATEPTRVQILAAQVRLKADKRLRRVSPPDIRRLAENDAEATNRSGLPTEGA